MLCKKWIAHSEKNRSNCVLISLEEFCQYKDYCENIFNGTFVLKIKTSYEAHIMARK